MKSFVQKSSFKKNCFIHLITLTKSGLLAYDKKLINTVFTLDFCY